VLWFRLSRTDDGKAESLGYVGPGGMLVAIDRDSYWQCALVIEKGGFEAVKARGLEEFRRRVALTAPPLAPSVAEIGSWEDVKLLSVAVDHLDTWYRPGLLCIGDAAHAMSPVGGVGINLAVQDAIAAARLLAPAFEKGGAPAIRDLRAVQERRSMPARRIQKLQVFLHTHLIRPALIRGKDMRIPWQLRLVTGIPYLRRLPAYVIGIGFRPEHIR
jgi:2-polyprenyl-6-methoxyphenol hydroxylase-like FAD-dependent oxidoreductase